MERERVAGKMNGMRANEKQVEFVILPKDAISDRLERNSKIRKHRNRCTIRYFYVQVQ